MLQNFLDNAIKYNDKATGLIQVSYQEYEKEWRFCVQDNGKGIDTPYQQKVFQLFQTLEPKDQQNNTGIGLSLVKKIITLWGGKVWLESVLGQGCRFFFTLPKCDFNVVE